MSVKFFLVFLLYVACDQANAQDNRICECNTEEDVKNNENLLDLLRKLEKLANEAAEEKKIEYAVIPGILDQFQCNCDEKSRKKRKAVEFEQPEEVTEKRGEDDNVEEVRQKRHLIKEISQYVIDLRCPKGTIWIAQAHTCVPRTKFDDTESEEQ